MRDAVRGRSPWLFVAVLGAAACLGWLPFLEPVAERRRGRLPDRRGAVVVRRFAVRRLLGGPPTGAHRDLRARRRPRRDDSAAAARDPRGGRDSRARRAARTRGGPRRRLGRRCSTAATAAVLCATPLFGGSVVNGELLGAPVRPGRDGGPGRGAHRAAPPGDPRWGLAAGACAALAVLVKQNMVDVFVMALALLASRSRSVRAPGCDGRRGGRHDRGRRRRLRRHSAPTRVTCGTHSSRSASRPPRCWRHRRRRPARGRLGSLVLAPAVQRPAVVGRWRWAGGLAPASGDRRGARISARPQVAGVRRARLGAGRGGARRQLLAALPDGPGPRGGACSPPRRSSDRRPLERLVAACYALRRRSRPSA